jgi:hypothetical protein
MIHVFVKKKDWFKALLLHKCLDGTLKSFITEYGSEGYIADIRRAHKEIMERSTLPMNVRMWVKTRHGYRETRHDYSGLYKSPAQPL